ncbi:MAG TPA: multicopper oxidase domain-containing protein [Candidatus Rubrimentiphilum sp.]|nr:multicopper oxidase domain-containing protein [Candidatus Rubrimentiphilum sp.]
MPNFRIRRGLFALGLLLAAVCAGAARADTDETTTGVSPSAVGMQPLRGAIPKATPAPGESRLFKREDGTFQAIPTIPLGAHPTGTRPTQIFTLVERDAPWTLQPGLTVMAKTYNGVVPGPTLVVHQGDRVEIDYRNEQSVPDTLHLHGIHEIPVSMDGVAGISQPLVMQGESYRYIFTADTPGTFIYHSHDNEEMVNSGLYGALVVLPAHPSPHQRADRDDVEVLSSWAIQSLSENHFTINGKEYPYTTPINVRKGQRVRIRWINISGESFHTMHTHGHYQRIVARDAQPLTYRDIEDTVMLGPGQRADVIITADQKPGNWLVHCHVIDHTEDAAGLPDGLVTTIHYEGTPNRLVAMNSAMRGMLPRFGTAPLGALPFGWTVLLGAIAGLTIFLGLPVARMRNVSPATIAALNAVAVGILVYLVVEIAGSATAPLIQAARFWHGGGAPWGVIQLAVAFVGGLVLGLVGLGILASRLSARAASGVHDPLLLAAIIAVGIGAHNFAEGLAIGASAASGATAIAVGLIIGFALHNATEGFGIAAPLSGRVVPSWGQIGLAGIVAGGPTFLGTVVGYTIQSPVLSVLFLATAIGALVFVIGELWAVLRRSTGITPLVTSMLTCGFVIALATELVLDLNGG